MSDFLHQKKRSEGIVVDPFHEKEFNAKKESQLEAQRQRFEEAKRQKKVRIKKAPGEEAVKAQQIEGSLDEQQKEVILAGANELVEKNMPPMHVGNPARELEALPGYKAPDLSMEAVRNLKTKKGEEADMKIFKAWTDMNYMLLRPGTENLYDKVYKNNSEVKSLDGAVNVSGLNINRLSASMRSRLGSGYSTDELAKLVNSLMPEVRMKHEKISKEQADKDFDASMMQLKGMYYRNLKYLERTYGKKLSQLHMEDVLQLSDIRSLRTDFSIVQDTEQLIKRAGKYFDPKNEEDEEFIRLSNYYNSVYVGCLSIYTGNTKFPGTAGLKLDDKARQAMGDGAHYGLEQFKKVTENDIGGPSFTEKEKKEYGIAVRNRAKKEGREDRLYGRFLDEEETERKIELPKTVTELIDEVLTWTKVRAETSVPVKKAAKALKKAKSREAQSLAMNALSIACRTYMEINGNKSFKSSRRKTVVTELLNYAPIYFANENAIELRLNSFEAKDESADIRMRTGMDVKAAVGFSSFNDLSQFHSAFAGDGMKEEEFFALIKKYGNDKAAPGRTEVMDELTGKLLAIDLSGFDYSSDKAIAKDAAKFERMSAMVEAYRDLLSENPLYLDSLKQRKTGQQSDHTKLLGQLEKLSAISDYYRVRKLIISDSEYIAGSVKDTNALASDSRGTVHLKELLRASDHITENLDRLFERKKKIEIRRKKQEDALSKARYSAVDKAFALDRRKLRTDRDSSYGMEREDRIREQIVRLERESASILDVRYRDCLGDINKDMPQKSGMFARLYSIKNTAQDGILKDTLRSRGRYAQRERVARLVKKLKGKSSTGSNTLTGAEKYPELEKFKIHDVPARSIEKYCSELYDDMSDNEIMELITHEMISDSPEYQIRKAEQVAKDAGTYGSEELQGMSKGETEYYEEAFADAAMKSLFRHNALFERIEQALGAKALFLHPADLINRMPDELIPLISAYSTITNIIEKRAPLVEFINHYQDKHKKNGKSYEGKYKLDAEKFVFGAEAYSSLLFSYSFYTDNYFVYQSVAYQKATAKQKGVEPDLNEDDEETYEKLKRAGIKKVKKADIDRCYEEHKNDPRLQRLFKESSLQEAVTRDDYKKVFIYYMVHPEAMSLDELKKMPSDIYGNYKENGLGAKGVRLLTENGYGNLPSSKDLKAYEKRLKDEGYKACHVDDEGKVVTKDPYWLKDIIAIAEEKESKKQTTGLKNKAVTDILAMSADDFKKAVQDVKSRLKKETAAEKKRVDSYDKEDLDVIFINDSYDGDQSLIDRLIKGAQDSAKEKGLTVDIDPDFEPLKLYMLDSFKQIYKSLNKIEAYDKKYWGLKAYCGVKHNMLNTLDMYKTGEKKFTKGMKPEVWDRFDTKLDDDRLAVEAPAIYDSDRRYTLKGIANVGKSVTPNGTFAASLCMQLKSRGIEVDQELIHRYSPPYPVKDIEKAKADGMGSDKEKNLIFYENLMTEAKPDMKMKSVSIDFYGENSDRIEAIRNEITERLTASHITADEKLVERLLDRQVAADETLREKRNAAVEKLRKSIIDAIVRQKSPVSAKLGDHYITIFGIEGSMVRYDDHTTTTEKSEKTAELGDLFSRGAELFWFEETQKSRELTEDELQAQKREKLSKKVKTQRDGYANDIVGAARYIEKTEKRESLIGNPTTDPIPKEEFDREFGQDVFVSELREEIKRAGESLDNPVAYPLGEIDRSEEGAKEQIKKALMAEQELFAEKRDSDREKARLNTYNDDFKESVHYRFKTDEELRTLYSLLELPGLKERSGATLMYNGKMLFKGGVFGVYDFLLDSKAEEFIYTSDADFVSSFAGKYHKLCTLAACKSLFTIYKKELETDSLCPTLSSAELMSRAEYFAGLKEHYDKRMRLISSPFYTRVSEAKLASYIASPETIDGIEDADFKSFVLEYKKLQESDFGPKKKNLSGSLKRSIEEAQIKKRDEDLLRIQKESAGIDFKEDPVDTLQTLYEKGKAQALSEYPKDNLEFLKKYELDTLGTVFAYMNPDTELERYRKAFIDIYEKGTVFGQKIKDEDQAKIKSSLDKLIGQRRTYMSEASGRDAFEKLIDAFDTDIYNPKLRETAEGKRMLTFRNDACMLKERMISGATKDMLIDYKVAFQEFLALLHEMDYTISEKYEDRIKRDEEKAEENARKSYQKRMYRNHPELEKKNERIELPKYRVNGKEYTYYNEKGITDIIRQKDLNIPGEEGNRVIELLDKLTVITRTRAGIVDDPKLVDGEGLFVAEVYELTCKKQEESIMNELFEIVSKYDADIAKEKENLLPA